MHCRKMKLLILLLIAAAWFRPAASGAEKAKLLVFPFERSSGAAATSWLREGLAFEICRQIRSPNVDTMDYDKRIEMVLASDLPPDAALSRASMIRVAQQDGADFLVMGSFAENAQGLKIVANVLDLKTLKLSSDISANGPLSALPQMENELSWKILGAMGAAAGMSRETFRSKTRIISNEAFALFIRGLIESDEAEAIGLLEQALSARADFPEAQIRLGRYYFQQGDCSRAIPLLAVGRDDYGDRPLEEFMLATCYLETDKLAEAVQTYARLNSVTASVESWNNQGIALARMGDYPAAAENFLQARRIARTDPTINLNLAILRHLEGNDFSARDILTDAVKSFPNSGMIQFVFGIVLKALGDIQQADSALIKAGKLNIQVEKLNELDPSRWMRIMPRWERP